MDSLRKFFNSPKQEGDCSGEPKCSLQGKSFSLLAAGANSPMLLLSADGRVVNLNPRACQLFECNRDELINRRLGEDWPDNTLANALISGLARDVAKPVMLEFTTTNGRQRSVWLEMHKCLEECGEEPCSVAIFIDITSLRKREEALERTLSNRLEVSSSLFANAESKYQSIVEASPDWISLISPQGDIFVINQSGANILEVDQSEVLAKSLWDYFSEFEAANLQQCLAEAIASRAKTTSEASLTRKSGQKYLDVVFNPLIDSDGAITRVVLLIADVSARRRAEIELKRVFDTLEDKVTERTEQLELMNLELAGEIAVREKYQQQLHEARQQAEAANHAKSDFLATMSHEIRTPMNSVLGFTNLLLNTELNEKQRDFAQTVKSSGKLLLALIDDILDLSKIEARKLELELLPFSMAEMLNEIVKLFVPRANEKNLELKLEIEEVFSNSDVIGDKQRIRQVLINLVGNAVKFTRSGFVRIKACSHLVPGGGFFADIMVEDSGIGIEQKDLVRIFGKFTQTESHVSRKFGGTGLGLAISKGLIELMGGTIGVCSTAGQGSEFFFHIPLKQISLGHKPVIAAGQDLAANQQSRDELKKTKILIVDDDEASLKLVEQCVVAAGHSFVSAKNGSEAVERLRDETFGLLIMDWMLPERSGLQIIRELRQENGPNQNAPVISVTARAMKGDREKCIEAGANFYLSKPYEPDELVRMICSILNLAR